MSSTYSTRFDLNGHTIEAELVMFDRTGRLNVWLDRVSVSEMDWVDWSEGYANDAGLRAAALSEIKTIIGAVDSGDVDAPDAPLLAAMREVAA